MRITGIEGMDSVAAVAACGGRHHTPHGPTGSAPGLPRGLVSGGTMTRGPLLRASEERQATACAPLSLGSAHCSLPLPRPRRKTAARAVGTAQGGQAAFTCWWWGGGGEGGASALLSPSPVSLTQEQLCLWVTRRAEATQARCCPWPAPGKLARSPGLHRECGAALTGPLFRRSFY